MVRIKSRNEQAVYGFECFEFSYRRNKWVKIKQKSQFTLQYLEVSYLLTVETSQSNIGN